MCVSSTEAGRHKIEEVMPMCQPACTGKQKYFYFGEKYVIGHFTWASEMDEQKLVQFHGTRLNNLQ